MAGGGQVEEGLAGHSEDLKLYSTGGFKQVGKRPDVHFKRSLWLCMDHRRQACKWGAQGEAVATLQVREGAGLDPGGNDTYMRRGQIPGVF